MSARSLSLTLTALLVPMTLAAAASAQQVEAGGSVQAQGQAAPAPAPAVPASSATATPGPGDTTAASSAAVENETPPPVVTGQAAETAAEEDAAASEGSDLPWALRHRAYNTVHGSTGSLFIEDPGFGEPGALRFQLALDTYSGSDFLYEDDEVEQSRQHLSVSWTALEMLEVFAALSNSGTVASRNPVTGRETLASTSLHTIGDTLVGFKVFFEPASVLRLGASARLFMLNDVGAQENMFDATSVGLRGNLALDFQGLDRPFPLIMRFNADYYFDNSAKVVAAAEEREYFDLFNPLPEEDEPRHLITRAERFGLGINRVDMLTFALGVELPLELAEDLYLHPMLDFRLGLPINRQGYDCPFFGSDDNRGTIEGLDDTCLDDAGASALPAKLAIAARLVPPIRGVSAAVGFDLGLSGDDVFVRELAPTAPYRFLVVLSYDYDAKPVEPIVIEPPPPAAPPPVGRVVGTVVDQGTDAPISGATVRFVDKSVTALSTDEQGRFVSYEFSPGAISLEITHPDYETQACNAMVPPSGGDVEVICGLSVRPPELGSVKAQLVDQFGAAVSGARVSLTGPKSASLISDGSGKWSVGELPAGEYSVRIESANHLSRVVDFTVAEGQDVQLEIALFTRPTRSSIQRRGSTISSRALRFAPESVELDSEAAQAVAEVADLMLNDPNIRLRIQGDGGESLALSRALAIKQRLVDAGVSDDRLEVVTEPAREVELTILP